MRNDLTPFRTVRELLVNRDEVLMSNAVDTEGNLYEDSVENLTAILAMQDSYNEMLAALEELLEASAEALSFMDSHLIEHMKPILDAAETTIAKAKGN